MSKDESETLKIGGTKIPQWLVTIVASLVTSLIVGYFTLQASLQPIQLQISATQTAESKIIDTPTAGVTPSPTAGLQQGSTPQQAITPSTPQTVNIPPSFFERYYLLIALWLFIAIANKHQRELLLEKFSILLGKPIIFRKDDTSPITLYPRDFLEQIAVSSLNISASSSIRAFTTGLRDYIKIKVQSSSSIFLGYIFRLVLFLFFLLGVMTATADSLKATFFPYSIPILLTHVEIGFFVGSLLAPILGLWTIIEPSNIVTSDFPYKNPTWRKITVFCSFLLVFFGFLVLVVWSIARLINVGTTLPQPYDIWMNQAGLITFSIIIPMLNLLASIVVMVDALTGLIITIASLVLVLFNIVVVVTFGIILPVILFILDVLVRSIIFYMYIASFVLLTPLDTLVTGLTRLINRNAT